MVAENINLFLTDLIWCTENRICEWSRMNKRLLSMINPSAKDFLNSVQFELRKSYYLKHKTGYVFLLKLKEEDEYSLAMQVRSSMPTDSYDYPTMKRRRKILAQKIEDNIEAQYSMPAALYHFMADVVDGVDSNAAYEEYKDDMEE